MATKSTVLLSVVVPIYNEDAGLADFHQALLKAVHQVTESYEIIYVDDGSQDDSAQVVTKLCQADTKISLLRLSRNFGKENALTAGLAAARGEAVLSLDGDGQHPVELIPKFVETWQAGAQVVIGLRDDTENETFTKKLTSKLFYGLFNALTSQRLIPGSTDYRLLDRAVVDEFIHLPEADRVTRGLIDWLGFDRHYIHFTAKQRLAGTRNYSFRKLIKLGLNSFVSLSPAPIYAFGYLGLAITLVSLIGGVAIIIEQLVLNDPLSWNFTGTAMLAILILFLVGILLVAQGVQSLYISHIHTQTKRRPLYVVNYKKSVGHDKPQV